MQVLLVLGQKGEALAGKLLEDLVLLLHEEEELTETTVFDEFPLDVDAVEKHRGKGYDNHLLINFMDLSEWLKNSRNNFVLDDLLLTIFLHTQIRNGSYNISKNFFFFLMI